MVTGVHEIVLINAEESELVITVNRAMYMYFHRKVLGCWSRVWYKRIWYALKNRLLLVSKKESKKSQ